MKRKQILTRYIIVLYVLGFPIWGSSQELSLGLDVETFVSSYADLYKPAVGPVLQYNHYPERSDVIINVSVGFFLHFPQVDEIRSEDVAIFYSPDLIHPPLMFTVEYPFELGPKSSFYVVGGVSYNYIFGATYRLETPNVRESGIVTSSRAGVNARTGFVYQFAENLMGLFHANYAFLLSLQDTVASPTGGVGSIINNNNLGPEFMHVVNVRLGFSYRFGKE